MKALRLYGPKDVRIDDIPVPIINERELLIKIVSCSICGSDFRNVASGDSGHGMDLPRVMGHELVGTIAEAGLYWKDRFSIGENIVVNAIIPCGRCHLCIGGYPNQCLQKQTIAYQVDGAFAEYMKVPEQSILSGNVLKVREQAKLQHLALSEPLSCAINGQEISQVKLGESVLIVGCGPLGLFHVQLALLNGANQVIAVDFDRYRLEIARNLGADLVLSPKEVEVTAEILRATNGLGVDVVMVSVPVPAVVKDALRWAKNRGRINIFGGMPKNNKEMEFDLNVIHYRELSIQGTSDSTPRQLKKAIDLINSGRIKTDFMISKIVSLEEAKNILAEGPQLEHIKIVVDPTL